MRRLLGCLSIVLAAAGCDEKPDAATIASWRREAQEANAKKMGGARDAGPAWNLHVGGDVESALDLTVDDVRALEAIEIMRPKTDVYDRQTFRGPKLSTLVDRARPRPTAETATIIGKDGYFATADLPDLRKFPFIMAYEQDGQPMTTPAGGPICVRFDPQPMPTELHRRYQYAGVLYTTHVIVGDEPAHLRVGAAELRDADLEKLPETSISGPVLYRTGWEPTPQTLWGVRLRDVITSTGVGLPGEARVLGKDSLHQEDASTPRFTVRDLDECHVMVVRRYGPLRRRVPTSMGGPLLLAINEQCRSTFGKKAWMWFVERVELLP